MYILIIAFTDDLPMSLSFFIYLPNCKNIVINIFPYETFVF